MVVDAERGLALETRDTVVVFDLEGGLHLLLVVDRALLDAPPARICGHVKGEYQLIVGREDVVAIVGVVRPGFNQLRRLHRTRTTCEQRALRQRLPTGGVRAARAREVDRLLEPDARRLGAVVDLRSGQPAVGDAHGEGGGVVPLPNVVVPQRLAELEQLVHVAPPPVGHVD